MAYTITPLAGVDLANVTTTNLNSAGTAIATFGPTGAEVFGSDGFRYVFAQAAAAIPAATATCVINASTFQVTLGVGTYLSGASMASGDYGWFSKASV
jgi:hypothetical protein